MMRRSEDAVMNLRGDAVLMLQGDALTWRFGDEEYACSNPAGMKFFNV